MHVPRFRLLWRVNVLFFGLESCRLLSLNLDLLWRTRLESQDARFDEIRVS
jgi:hypothetical protein